jgi:nucleotide-binding universal stress UspA family protein
MREFIKKVAQSRTPPNLKLRTIVLEGSPAEQIVDLPKSEKVKMIVTATHGSTGWRKFIFGSVAEKVVRLASCPVPTIPAPPEQGQV